jgi:hypothetical protein
VHKDILFLLAGCLHRLTENLFGGLRSRRGFFLSKHKTLPPEPPFAKNLLKPSFRTALSVGSLLTERKGKKMKVTTLTVDYQVTRSRDFQSVRLGGSVALELTEGDDKKECLEKARRWLAGQLNAAADEELENVLFGPRK